MSKQDLQYREVVKRERLKSANMSVVNAKEIRAFHRPFYNKWRAQHGIEAMREPLSLLLDQGYTMTDISVMLGISRERVRQFVARWNLSVFSKHITARRIWDDETNRFHPVSEAKYQELHKQQHRKRLTTWRHNRQKRMVNRLKKLAAGLDRTPTLGEFAVAWFGRKLTDNALSPMICGAWSRSGGESAATITKTLYSKAGLTVRSTGSPGHLTSKWQCTKHERSQMMSLRNGGHTIKETAQIVGRSVSTVWQNTRGPRAYNESE